MFAKAIHAHTTTNSSTSTPVFQVPTFMPGDADSDEVSLQPFMDYINDPTLLQALMEEQGVENIDSVEPIGPLGGGTADNNYYGYIHWTDGTETKVQIKGSRSTDTPPASYREQAFYSRVTDTFNDDVHTPYSYTSVFDLSTGQGIFVNEFMVNYTSLQDVQTALIAGTLDEIGFSDFNLTQNAYDVMEMMGHFHGSHFEDPWLEEQFYMKGYDWFPNGNMTAGEELYMSEKGDIQEYWRILQLNPFFTFDDNLIACIDRVLELWTWENFQEILTSDNYTQSIVHGDFHAGQVMISNSDMDDLVLLDWEWSGFSNPVIDIATYFNFYPENLMTTNEEAWLETYYMALVKENPNVMKTYSYEQLYKDFLTIGTSHILVRNVGVTFINFWDITTGQFIMDAMATWVNEHNLTPDDMTTPMYQWF